MRFLSCILAFVVLGGLLSLPVLGADDKDKKADAKKDDATKAEVKKDDAKKPDAKKDDAAKKDDTPKKTDKKSPAMKLPTPKKGALKNLDKDPEAAEAKIMKSGVVQGRVMAVIEDKKTIRLQLTIPYMKINPGAVQNYQNAQMSLLRATNPQGVLQAQQQMAQAEAQIYQVATVQKDVEWQATDDAKVRRREPPPQFDDKGRVKRYTKKELKELKGDDKLPGYPAEFSDIKQDQIVEVTLVRKKDAARTPVKKGKDADPEVLGDNLPHMSMIVILVEPKN
jgi:hypothetical protein